MAEQAVLEQLGPYAADEAAAYDAGYAAKLAGWDREAWPPEGAAESGLVRSWLQGWDAAEQALYHRVMQLKREATRG
jgi:hypothetical protein